MKQESKVPKVTATIEVVDPVRAKELFAKIKSNRDLDPKHVNSFVRLMEEKKFRDYGLVFVNGDGDPFDAQHRFMAQIQTGYTTKYVFLKGLSKEDLNMLVDSGRNRSHAQRLKAIGLPHSGTLASAIQVVLQYELKWKDSSSMVFADEIVDYLSENQELVSYAQAWSSDRIKIVSVPTIVAFQHLFTKSDAAKADIFLMGIASSGHDLEEGDPRLTFRQFAEGLANEESTARKNKWIQNGLVTAWNAFRKGETLEVITPSLKPVKIEEAGQPEPEEEVEIEAEAEEVA